MTREQQYRVLTQAQADWVLRERGFPKHVRQRWDQATPLAHNAALVRAAEKLGFL